MSQYLVIKKNGVGIGEWNRSTYIYKSIPVNSLEPKEFNPRDVFRNSLEFLKDEKSCVLRQEEIYNKMLSGNLTYDERYDTIMSLKEIEEQVDEIERDISVISFLLYNCSETSNGENSDPDVWTMYIE